MTAKTKYYTYNITEPPYYDDLSLEYGKVWIYKINLTSTSHPRYLLSLFNRRTREWEKLWSTDRIPRGFKLINKKELFLEML